MLECIGFRREGGGLRLSSQFPFDALAVATADDGSQGFVRASW